MKALFDFFSSIILLGVVVCLIGCTKAMDQQKISYTALYADSVFLGFEGDLNDPHVIDEHLDVYLPAYQRMVNHLKFKDNILCWDFEKASDLKISENIYNYLIDAWNYDNKLLQSGKYVLELASIGYKITPKEKKLSSRYWGDYPYKLEKGREHFSKNIDVAMLIYEEYYVFQYLGDYVNYYYSDFSNDNYGNKELTDKVTVVENGYSGYYTYYFFNGCTTSWAFECEANETGSPYSSDIKGKNGIREVIIAVRNGYYKHVCSTVHVWKDTIN